MVHMLAKPVGVSDNLTSEESVMITAEIQECEHYTGERITYCDTSPRWLFKQLRTESNTDKRAFAAAGLLRAVMDAPLEDRSTHAYQDGFEWATHLLLCMRSTTRPLSGRNYRMNDYVANLPHIKASLDSVTTAATRANQPTELATLIEKQHGVASNKLVIGLGHGGIIAAADTFLAMSGENVFYPARYSRNKHKDQRLRLSAKETGLLGEIAHDKTVVVIDEDSATSQTIETAIAELKNVLQTEVVFGATVVESSQPDRFDPQITATRDFWDYEWSSF